MEFFIPIGLAVTPALLILELHNVEQGENWKKGINFRFFHGISQHRVRGYHLLKIVHSTKHVSIYYGTC